MRDLAITAVITGFLAAVATAQVMAWRHDAKISEIQAQAAEATKAATDEVLARERANHDRLAKAAQTADKRQREASASAAAARDDLRLLNDAANQYAADLDIARAAADLRADTLSSVLGECAGQLQGLAAKADGHATDAKRLLESWPR